MNRGFFKIWRKALEEDLYRLTPHEFKLWLTLMALAQHTRWRDLDRGQLRITYEQLRSYLSVEDGGTYSQHTLQSCLKRLETLNYITILEAQRGRRLLLRIEKYDELQGDQDFCREEYPPEADDPLPLRN
ncbi:MAG TPA: hypothetical protein VNT01_12540 [Symbiobacteriaceae bacterium]|nr:hypothetical protein [Symbiobacteriaceae bacterium]